MNIDCTHKRWLIGLGVLAGLAGAYGALPSLPAASSPRGLALGLVGTALAVFCGLLPVRKKLLRVRRFAKWPALRSAVWEKGHIYFGLLGCLALHLHAGFHRGGSVTTMLLAVLWAILLSGVSGLLFRHLLPLAKAAKEGKGLVAARIITAGHQASLRCHVPLTLTLFGLAAVHAVMALSY